MTDPWKATHFKNGYAGEFLPTGERSWRYVKAKGEVVVFFSREEAKEAAKKAFLERYEPPLRATIERSPEEELARMEDKLAAEAERFLKSNRQDVKSAETIYRPGKRPLVAMPGRVRA